MVRIAVVGAGVIGLGSAVRIKEKYRDIEVVLISKEFSPNTTGDGSGGLWNPYLSGNNSNENISKWGLETYKLYHQLWLEGSHNICLLPLYTLRQTPCDSLPPLWAKDVFGYHHIERRQLDYFCQLYSTKYVQGHTYTSFIVSPPLILAYLTHRFIAAGGRIVQATVTSLSAAILDSYDVVINCTGVKAREMVPDDTVYPIRGQVIKVDALWMNEAIIEEDGDSYILPNYKTTLLGGTHQEHNYSTDVSAEDTTNILRGCRKIIPGLEHSAIVNNWVGLRPARDITRIEGEKSYGKFIIHNYGHGGSGMTLFWGCAAQVLQILDSEYFNNTKPTVSSKL